MNATTIPAAGGSCAIALERVSKAFGKVVALAPTDLAVEKGEFLTLLGPSGSGKTTLLNLISGNLEPSSGRILLDGRDITHAPPRDRGIGMVFQNYALMPHMTVFENVAYPLKIRRESKAEIRRKVGEALERVGLTAFDDRKPRQLSGGQQQRVGIARCIVYSPAIIMMDEPLGALDKNLREQMQDEVKRLHRDIGTTFIYVTHDQEEALNMSDRICLMSNGAVAQLGTPDELYFTPRNRFVASFIGESNILSGTMAGPGLLRTAGGTAIRVPEQASPPPGASARIMIRPERIRLHRRSGAGAPAPSDRENAASGRVGSVSFVGGATRVHVEADGDLSLVAKVVSETGESRFRPGEPVDVAWTVADTVPINE